VKFGILIVIIAIKLKKEIQKHKNTAQGRIQGPLTRGEMWSKALPGIVKA